MAAANDAYSNVYEYDTDLSVYGNVFDFGEAGITDPVYTRIGVLFGTAKTNGSLFGATSEPGTLNGTPATIGVLSGDDSL